MDGQNEQGGNRIVESKQEDNANKSVSEIIYEVTEDICNHYCKYPDTWDE